MAPAKKLIEIKSPMVGTFYAKPDPEKPDYVTVGSKVDAEDGRLQDRGDEDLQRRSRPSAPARSPRSA